jgi:hypothetical protein
MKRLALFTVLALSLTAKAQAVPITFSAASGNLAASVVFTTDGSNLVVTLTNTSAFDVLAPADLLTGVFFDFASPVTLTRASAVLGPGSSVLNGGSDAGGVVGGEWAYTSGIGGSTPGGQNYGISSAGLGVFSPGDNFPGSNLAGPVSVNGMQYGIVSAGDNHATGNSPILSTPLIDNSVVFTLGGLPQGFDPSLAIRNVAFQYGTNFSEPRLRVTEPGTLTLLALSSVLFTGGRRKIRRSSAPR